MSTPATAKCACQTCGLHLEFPVELDGSTIDCPGCNQPTLLAAPISAPSRLTIADLSCAFNGRVPKTPTSFFYQLGLVFVAITMLILPVIYVLLIIAAGWAVYYWATNFTGIMTNMRGRAVIIGFIAYITPLLAGATVVLFMIKPLFARRPKAAQPLALNPGAEPLLFTFITKICEAVGAPAPSRIDLDCQLNASASFRRGVFSKDLVLTIGLPLVAGMNTRQLAGVIAHEFGHFTQGFGMRLTYIIRSVNMWFARVVYERDAWDVTLEEWAAEAEDFRAAIVIACVRLAVWCSRLVLKVLMYFGHGIGCFMLKQMEYDADSYEIKLVGSEAFEQTCKRIHVLGSLLGRAYRDLRPGPSMICEFPDNFSAYLMQRDAKLTPDKRTKLEDTLGLEASGVFDTHPSWGDRIRCARHAQEPGIFFLERPATELFTNFEVPARQVTWLHYTDDMGIPEPLINLVPVRGASADGDDLQPVESKPEPKRFKLKTGTS